MAEDSFVFISRLSRAALLGAAVIVAGCAASPSDPDALIADPYENTNRTIHSVNKGIDSAVVRPLAQGYDLVTPMLVKHLVSNELKHLQLPGYFVNRVLQGDIEEAGAVLGRFTINTLMGAGGLLDPATEIGLPHEPTDFGVTLAEWGAEEGAYVEMPLLGPSTSRHAVGRIVDIALDPTILVTAGVVELPTVLEVVDAASTPVGIVNARYENAEILDQVLYESDDSYIAARTGYVQNRRRFVAGETDTENLPDIFQE